VWCAAKNVLGRAKVERHYTTQSTPSVCVRVDPLSHSTYLGVVVVAEVVVLVPAALIQRRAVPQVTLQGEGSRRAIKDEAFEQAAG
jgi:hypothetical protein